MVLPTCGGAALLARPNYPPRAPRRRTRKPVRLGRPLSGEARRLRAVPGTRIQGTRNQWLQWRAGIQWLQRFGTRIQGPRRIRRGTTEEVERVEGSRSHHWRHGQLLLHGSRGAISRSERGLQLRRKVRHFLSCGLHAEPSDGRASLRGGGRIQRKGSCPKGGDPGLPDAPQRGEVSTDGKTDHLDVEPRRSRQAVRRTLCRAA
mmetsp:Transcript_54471/g.129373  ORF Transcript_54471/g.129373 Transcript_54471/m.129373 type:complete len:204 (-) Transcript_54471:388-999(-)